MVICVNASLGAEYTSLLGQRTSRTATAGVSLVEVSLLWGPGLQNLQNPALQGQKVQFVKWDPAVFTPWFLTRVFFFSETHRYWKDFDSKRTLCPGRIAPILWACRLWAGTLAMPLAAQPSTFLDQAPLSGEESEVNCWSHGNGPLPAPPGQ